jgi:chemotaxis signal transduction protein
MRWGTRRGIRAPRHQRGVLNYDGVVVPVLDLRRLLGIESVTRRPFSMVIVTRVPSDTGAEIVGFVVERVLAVTAERH